MTEARAWVLLRSKRRFDLLNPTPFDWELSDLAEASAYVPSDRHVAAIGMRDAFLNELLANNCIDPFLLRLDADTRLHAGNMLGRLLADMVPDADLQALHDGTLPVSKFLGLQDAIRELATAEPGDANLKGAFRQPSSVLLETSE